MQTCMCLHECYMIRVAFKNISKGGHIVKI